MVVVIRRSPYLVKNSGCPLLCPCLTFGIINPIMMINNDNCGESSLGAGTRANKVGQCSCTSAEIHYDSEFGGSVDSVSPAITCQVCIAEYEEDMNEHDVHMHEVHCIHIADMAHYYMSKKYSIQCDYRMPTPACASLHTEDDLPF